MNTNLCLADILHKVTEEKESVFIPCPRPVKGFVTWSRVSNGNKVDILTTDGIKEIKHYDPDGRYTSNADKFKILIIRSALASDTGKYLCNNEPAAELTVYPSGEHLTSLIIVVSVLSGFQSPNFYFTFEMFPFKEGKRQRCQQQQQQQQGNHHQQQ